VTLRGGVTQIHGHRGARGLRPENTLPGFVHAFELGVDAVELDVGRTRDGVVVLSHDQTVSAVTCSDTGPLSADDESFPYVGRRIRELSLAQFKTLDAGVRRPSDVDPYLFTQLPIRGTPPPSLAEVCALLRKYDKRSLSLAIELKTDPSWPDAEVRAFVAAVCEVVEDHGLTRRARVLGFDWRVVTAARDLGSALGRVALVEDKTIRPDTAWLAGYPPDDWMAGAVAAGAQIISPDQVMVTSELVFDAHSLGLPITPWTVNEPEEMARFLEYGVDAIVTDYPDRLRTVMATHGLAVPSPAALRPLLRAL
jgi:glycerophosphoryl diester phosphodiesterase